MTQRRAARRGGPYDGATVEYSILGPFEVRREGEPVDLGTPKQRALLLRLLLAGGRVVSVDRLVDDLWAGDPPAAAAGTLQSYISNLRRALEPERGRGAPATLLLTRAPGYVLAVERDEVDAAAFEDAVARARGALTAGDPHTAADLLRRAQDRWRGEALAEVAGEPWAVAEAARLEELRQSAAEDRIDALLALGDAAGAVSELESLVSQRPLRERRQAQLMVALYRTGRQADALRAYSAARQQLVEQMGIEPGPALQRVEDLVLRQSADLEWAPPAVPPQRAARAGPGDAPPPAEPAADGRVRLVGRDPELAVLGRAVGDALAGRRQIVLIGGEAGIGKTRLTEELAARARRAGMLILEGRGFEGAGAPPYWPWLQVLRQALAEVPEAQLRAAVAPDASELAAVLPEIKELVPGINAPVVLDADTARFRLADAFAGTLARLSAATPLVVVLDDLHWTDPGTLAILRFLARSLRAAQVLVAATYRPNERGPHLVETLADLAREPDLVRLDLAGLRAADVATVLAARLGTEPSASTAARVAERSAGNPFFVHELARALAAAAPGDEMAALGSVPAGVRDVLQLRLAALPPRTTELLQTAAVAGRRVDLHLLEAMADDALDHLEPALVAGVLVPVSGSLSRLRFVHDLLHETVLVGIPPLRRARLHGQLGRLLARIGDPQPDELAEHFFAAAPAGFADEAFGTALTAADHCLRVAAHDRAAEHLARAQGLIDRLPPIASRDERELRVTARLGALWNQTRGVTDPTVGEAFARVRQLSASVGHVPELLPTNMLNWGHNVVQGRFADARTLAEEMLELAASTGNRAFSAMGSVGLGNTQFHLGDLPAGRASLLQGIAQAEEVPDIVEQVGIHPGALGRAFLAPLLAEAGDEPGSRAMIAEATRHAAPRPFDLAHAYSCTAWAAVILRDVELARSEAETGVAVAEKRGFPFYVLLSGMNQAWAIGMGGDPAGGAEQMDRLLAAMAARRVGILAPFHHCLRAELALQAGRPDQAASHLGLAFAAVDRGERHFEPALHIVKARLRAATGDAEGAVGALADAVATAGPHRGVYARQAATAAGELGIAAPVG